MKYIFLFVGIGLSLLAYITPIIVDIDKSAGSKLTWATDINPGRLEQVENFYKWRKEKSLNQVEIALDSQNRSTQKVIIQGVTGVAADLVDAFGFSTTALYNNMGLAKDLTKDAEEMDFSYKSTYPGLKAQLVFNGKQIAYPANVATSALFINHEAFNKVNMPVPKKFDTYEDFEKMGVEYVKRANRGLDNRKYFFSFKLDFPVFARSFGADHYNETMTGSGHGHPSWVKAYELQERWQYKLNLLPTAAQEANFSTEGGWGGAHIQLFRTGNYATLRAGRQVLLQFRKFPDMPEISAMTIDFFPFPVETINSRNVFIYQGTEKTQEAKDFLAYLASETYNQSIVKDGDGLPPNPKYLKSKEYLQPEEYPDEWDIHRAFYNEKINYLPWAFSPYDNPFVFWGLFLKPIELWQANVLSIEEALQKIETDVNESIKKYMLEVAGDELKERYEKALEDQKKIDTLKAQGKKIPASLIANPFHLDYYRHKGMLIEK